ncbi:hypothetical protein MC885_007697, partial [Smutsia gigantea]
YLKAELRLTCAGKAEGRSKRRRGLLSVGTPALAGKWSGTAAFLLICTVTRAVWKEVGRRCACCTWISVHKCVRVPVRLCTENFLGLVNFKRRIDGIFLAAICAACIRINPGLRQTAPGSSIRGLFGPARDARWLLSVRAAASPAFSKAGLSAPLDRAAPRCPAVPGSPHLWRCFGNRRAESARGENRKQIRRQMMSELSSTQVCRDLVAAL